MSEETNFLTCVSNDIVRETEKLGQTIKT